MNILYPYLERTNKSVDTNEAFMVNITLLSDEDIRRRREKVYA